MPSKIPIILDTDIGGDIDDSWALALLLKSPEIDLRLVLTATGNTTYRGAVAAKYLQAAGRSEVPIGIGLHQSDETGLLAEWLGDDSLDDYPGPVYTDGVGRLIEILMQSPEPVTLLCIGPAPNIRAALEREPRIAGKARMVGMFGSLRLGYDGEPEPTREWNVYADPDACRALFHGFPGGTITPLDTCGTVTLSGDEYQRILNCRDPLIQTMITSYQSWARHVTWTQVDAGQHSSVLFDTVAVYLAIAEDWVAIEELGLQITQDGYTRIDPSEPVVRCATRWRDYPAYVYWLVDRLTA
jgi:inosine-uridine nucleoside N-ribohydrolase